MADIWWHIARTPDGVWADELGPDPSSDAVAAVQSELGFPDGWWTVPGWDSRLGPGEPHRDILAAATVRRATPAEPGTE